MRAHRLLAFVAMMAAVGMPTAAAAQPCPANVPHLHGQWTTLPYLMAINPISATLMHNGRVLVVAGSENDAYNDGKTYRNAVWDPTLATQDAVDVRHVDYDVFCSGTAALFDGRALVVGGTADYEFTGDSRASIFDPATSSFLQTQGMVDGRWYATATALGDGRIMAFSGIEADGDRNNTVEIFDLRVAGAPWSAPAAAPFSPPLFPRMALLPSGKVFFTGQGSSRRPFSWLFDPGPKTWQPVTATTRARSYGSAVLLPLRPPAYAPKVMNFGGSGSDTTELIDLSASNPVWTPGPDMSAGRIECNATLLPDGTVLAQGGSAVDEMPDPPGKQADLYDPTTNTMRSAGTASYSRLYHSVALLLPDATVASFGSNPSPSAGGYEGSIEIYTPAYLFDENDEPITTGRPEITGVTPGPLGYGVPFEVTYASTSPIASAVLVRPGSSTHAGDMEQRLVALCGAAPQPPCAGDGTLSLTTPPAGSVAPPGYYMLFLVDAGGVPSKARFVQLSHYTTAPPAGTITSPASDETVASGGTVFFEAAPGAAQYSWVFPGGTPPTSSARVPGDVAFATPGRHVVSLTVLDATGNSDPSPPTRTVTVNPSAPDFEIQVDPPWWSIVPGQSVPYTVTVTPRSGFTGTVALTAQIEHGFPLGVSNGGFVPPTITGGAGSSTLTIDTTTAARPWVLTLTVKGTSSALARAASTSLLINLPPPATLTATPASGQVALAWPASVGATRYHVKRARQSGGPYVGLACTTATTFLDTGVADGTTYHYVVAPMFSAGPNAGGEGADSPEATATPPTSTTTTTTSTSTTSSTSTSTSSSTSSSTTSSSSTSTSSTTTTSTSSSSSTTSSSTSSSTTTSTSTSSSSSSTSTSTSTTTSSSSSTTSSSSSTTTSSSTSTSSSTTTSTSTSSSSSSTSTSTSTSTSSSSSTTSSSTSTSSSTTSTTTSSTSTTSASSSTTSSTTEPPPSSTTTLPTRPPSCEGARAAPPAIAPADGGFVGIAIDGVGDPDGDAVTLSVTSVTQDEPLRRKPCGDAGGLGGATADLRASRGDARGRAYRVRFEAEDGRGGRCAGSVLVCVPGPRTPAGTCAEEGATVYSTAPGCTGLCAAACGVERSLGHARCAGEAVPPKLARAVEKARRRMVRAAKQGAGPWVGAAIRSMERAARMATAARAAGHVSPACADGLMRVLGDARAAAAPLREARPVVE